MKGTRNGYGKEYNEIGELIHSGGYYNGLRDKKTYFASYPSMSIFPNENGSDSEDSDDSD